jgi:hypothetical protein
MSSIVRRAKLHPSSYATLSCPIVITGAKPLLLRIALMSTAMRLQCGHACGLRFKGAMSCIKSLCLDRLCRTHEKKPIWAGSKTFGFGSGMRSLWFTNGSCSLLYPEISHSSGIRKPTPVYKGNGCLRSTMPTLENKWLDMMLHRINHVIVIVIASLLYELRDPARSVIRRQQDSLHKIIKMISLHGGTCAQ